MPHAFFSQRPLVFAHRGGSGLAPENTITAFDQGLELGADGLELDVRLTRDGEVVVHHDATLDRTTNERGAIDTRSARELARVDAGYAFARGRDFPYRSRGIGIPTLREVLDRYDRIPIIVELKVNRPEMAEGVVRLVREARALDRVCIGSFGATVLRAVRVLEPAIATSAAREEVRWALYRSWFRWPLRSTTYAGFQVPERAGRTRVVSRRFVEAAHRAGLGVQVWTVDMAAEAERLLAWDVDGLITDRPDVIVPIVRGRRRP
jgi:glycerophosphoryl diester phosphodiesterase